MDSLARRVGTRSQMNQNHVFLSLEIAAVTFGSLAMTNLGQIREQLSV